MSGPKTGKITDSLEALLQGKAQALLKALEQDDLSTAMALISELQEARHAAFYREVGYLTRGLHEAIKSFSADIGVPEAQRGQLSAMGDASERLDYVIQLTEQAAHDTLDRIDRSLALLDQLAERQDLPAETAPNLERVRGELTEILVGQGFQDITGQLIRRVMQLLTQVESQLVHLVEMAAKVDRLNSVQLEEACSVASVPDPVRAEGPQVRPADSAAVARNQDDVDDLLSSLGF